MCLAALSLDRHRRFPLVLAANRDEYFARPASPVGWWAPRPAGVPILSGRDLEAGGTWLGLSANGRLALLTNVRAQGNMRPTAPSRGGIVTDWLESVESPREFWHRHSALPYNGFNLIAGDLIAGEWYWASNRAPDARSATEGTSAAGNANAETAPLRALVPALYGLSNAALDTPWPKVVTLKQRLDSATQVAVDNHASVHALAIELFTALADRYLARDEALPSTGVPPDWERVLSAAFIDAPERGYGTRCSSVVITERGEGSGTTHVFELTHPVDAKGHRAAAPVLPGDRVGRTAEATLADLPGLRHFVLHDWPSQVPLAAA